MPSNGGAPATREGWSEDRPPQSRQYQFRKRRVKAARGARIAAKKAVRVVKAGGLYFVLVFGAGFVLGTIRQLLVIPRLGVMWAELLEMPLMLVVIVAAARWVVRRLSVPPKRGARLGMGGVALALLLGAEIGVVLELRGLTLAEYVAQREPVSGVVYLVMLAVYAATPWLIEVWDERLAGGRLGPYC